MSPSSGTLQESFLQPVHVAQPEGSKDSKGKHFTPVQASFALAKCVVGAGCFVLPAAFKNSGLILGFFGLLLLGAFTLYTIRLLADTEYRVRDESPHHKLNYVLLGQHLVGNWLGWVIWVGVQATILGVCAVYIDLIGHLMASVYTPLSQFQYQMIMLPFLLALSLLRNLKYLAFTSILGDIAVSLGALFVIVYGAVKHGMSSPFDLPAARLDTFPAFFSSTVFLFAVHVVALPISQQMKNSEEFGRAAKFSYLFISIVNALFGAAGYMLYGDNTQGLVLDNLDSGVWSNMVKVLLCVDLFFTIPIVTSAPRELLEMALLGLDSTLIPTHDLSKVENVGLDQEELQQSKIIHDPWLEWKRGGIRWLVVFLFYAIAIGVPDLNDLVDLVGGLVSPVMGFILPATFYIIVSRREISTLSLVLHGLIVVFGVVSLVLATYLKIHSMTNKKQS